jgi:hypothetical protein
MTITTVELARDTPFGLKARFAEDMDGKTWFHLVDIHAMSTTGEPLIIGGKGPARNNYRIVPATIYSNYRGLGAWEAGGRDDFGVLSAIYAQHPPARHLVEADGALLVRFSASEVAQWLDAVLKMYAKSGGLDDDDEARLWTRRMAPFCTLTDEDVARLDGALPATTATPAPGGTLAP